MERHAQALSRISSTIRSYFAAQVPYRIAHGSTNSTRPAHLKRAARVVDISALDSVLSVDRAARTALVEPNVPMDALVSATLPHGLVPPVVMEFPGITAGGGFAGTAGESSSFRHGYFDATVRSVEMVLPDGTVVNVKRDAAAGAAQQDQYADLFKGAAASVGTLGVTTLLELELVEAKRFVRTTYRRTNSVAEAIRVVKEECKPEKGNDYVDGILYSKDHGVVVSGVMTNEGPKEGERGIRTFSGAWDPWYYMHVKEVTKGLPSSAASDSTPADGRDAPGSYTEHIPLPEYLFRYDRGGFWVGAAAFDYFRPLVPFNRLTRWFLDDFLHTRMLYRALHASGESAKFFVQDLALPYETAEPFIDYVEENLGIWPLWLCPLKTPRGPTFHPHLRPGAPGYVEEKTMTTTKTGGEQQQKPAKEDHDMMLNIGVWGWGPAQRDAFVAANRDLERRLDELGGMKWLYAHTYYTPAEFWTAYGERVRTWYAALRAKYRAASLPDVYDKVRVKDELPEGGWRGLVKRTWPLGGLIGVWKGIRSRDYLLHRHAAWKWKGEGEGEGGKHKAD